MRWVEPSVPLQVALTETPSTVNTWLTVPLVRPYTGESKVRLMVALSSVLSPPFERLIEGGTVVLSLGPVKSTTRL